VAGRRTQYETFPQGGTDSYHFPKTIAESFVYPRNPAIADLKRVIAAGESTIEIRNGVTYVNGKPSPEPYLRSALRRAEVMREVRVLSGAYYVMGGNREQSEDSRNYGVIMRERIVGKRWP
jgi:signal peptidase I